LAAGRELGVDSLLDGRFQRSGAFCQGSLLPTSTPVAAWLCPDGGQVWELIYLKVDPKLDPLRSDARFTDLLKKLNLP
jgi:hypothetical protein